MVSVGGPDVAEIVSERIDRWVRLYNRGGIAQSEFVARIELLAIHPGFFAHLSRLPSWARRSIEDHSLMTAGHPDDILIIRSYCGPNRSPEETAARQRAERTEVFWAARRIHEHFHPGVPVPVFERVRLIGEVEETIENEGRIVCIGDFEFYLACDHPLVLDTPRGVRTTLSSPRFCNIRRDSDAESDDFMVRDYGREGLMPGPPIESTTEVPPGTDVFVDRSALPELPDEPPGWLFERDAI